MRRQETLVAFAKYISNGLHVILEKKSEVSEVKVY